MERMMNSLKTYQEMRREEQDKDIVIAHSSWSQEKFRGSHFLVSKQNCIKNRVHYQTK